MKHLSILLGLIFSIGTMTQESWGQESPPQYFIAFRTTQPKTIEFDDRDKGQTHAQALRTLGVKPQLEDHAGHLDVTYSQPRWTLLRVTSDELVHQWEGWLKKSGFQTLHGDGDEHGDHDHGHGTSGHQHEEHTAGDGHAHHHDAGEIVAFRAQQWTTSHDDGNVAATQDLVVICKALGCQVREETHGGHADVSFRCPDWRHVECGSHAEAESLTAWLKKLGFEVRHEDEESHPARPNGRLQPIR